MKPVKPRQPPDKPTASVKSPETLLDSKHLFAFLISHGGEKCRLDIQSVAKCLQTFSGDENYDERKAMELVNSFRKKFKVKTLDGKQFVEATSSLKLCELYQDPELWCWSSPCKGLHICPRFLKGNCWAGDTCEMPHAFANSETTALLVQHKLDTLSTNARITLFRKIFEERQYSKVTSTSGHAKRSNLTEALFSYLISRGEECCLDIPSVVKRLQMLTGDKSYDQTKTLDYVNSFPEKFHVKTVEGKQFIEAKSSLKLCEVHQNPVGYCWSSLCQGLHICCHVLSGSGKCLAADECEQPHRFDGPKTRALLVKHKLDFLSPDNLTTLYRKVLKERKYSGSSTSRLSTSKVYNNKGDCNLNSDNNRKEAKLKKDKRNSPTQATPNLPTAVASSHVKCTSTTGSASNAAHHKLYNSCPNAFKTSSQNTLREYPKERASSTSGPTLSASHAAVGKSTAVTRSRLTQAMFSYLISHGEECRLDIPSVVKHLQTFTGNMSYDQIKMLDLVNSSPEKFEVKSVGGKQFVEAKSSLKLCEVFQKGKCSDNSCKGLHICRSFLEESCQFGDECKKPHGFDNPRERALLVDYKLNELSSDALKTLFKNTLRKNPKVHVSSTSGPNKGDSGLNEKPTAAKGSNPTEAMFSYLTSQGENCRLDIHSVVKWLQTLMGDKSYNQRKVLEIVNSFPKKFKVKTVDGKQFVKAKSSLKLCQEYQNSAEGCWASPCKSLHICRHFLLRQCSSADKCKLAHEFGNPETKDLLVHHKMDKLPKKALKTLLRNTLKKHKVQTASSSSSTLGDSNGKPRATKRSRFTEAMFSYLISHGEKCRLDIPSVVKHLQALTDGESYNERKVHDLVTSSPEKFKVETVDGKQFIEAKSSLKLCEGFLDPEKWCSQGSCEDLHICRHFLIGKCWDGDKCKRPHFHSRRTNALLVQHKMDSLSQDAFLTLFRKVLKERKYQSDPVKRSPAEAIFLYLIQHGEECCLDISRVVKGLQTSGTESYNQRKVLDLVNSSPDIFEVKIVDGKQFVKAKSSLKLCDKFQVGKCRGYPCEKGLHICCRYLLGKCSSTGICKMPHGFGHPQARVLLGQHKLDKLPTYAMRNLFRNTLRERRCNVHAMYTPAEAMFIHLISHGEECRLDIPNAVKFLQKFSGSNSYDQKKVLELVNVSPEQFEVRTIDGKEFVQAKSLLSLCEVFQARGKCTDGACKSLHICPFVLQENCQFRRICKKPHGFDNPRTRALLVHYKLDDLSSDALVTLLRSTSKVYSVYNNGDCTFALRDERQSSTAQATPNVPTTASSHVESEAAATRVNIALHAHRDGDQQNDRFQTKPDEPNRRRSAKYLKFIDEKTTKDGLEE